MGLYCLPEFCPIGQASCDTVGQICVRTLYI